MITIKRQAKELVAYGIKKGWIVPPILSGSAYFEFRRQQMADAKRALRERNKTNQLLGVGEGRRRLASGMRTYEK